MLHKRRDFIKITAASLAVTVISRTLPSCSSTHGLHKNSGKLNEFGLQLYTLRYVVPADARGTLKQVVEMGYKQVESIEGNKGIYFGMTNIEFKKNPDDIGLVITSSHCNIDSNFEQKAGEASAIGMKYLLRPYIGKQKTLDDYKKIADKFNDRGEICRKAGIKFGYHNHDYSFI